MAQLIKDFDAKLQTIKDGEVVVVHLAQGDEVKVIEEWENRLLVKDRAGHFYNLPKDVVQN